MLMDAKGIIRRTEDILRSDYQININEADAKQLHRALSDAVMYAVADDWRRSRRNRETGRRAYYLSAEYLTGRMIFNNLFVLNLLPEVSRLLALRGVDINIMESIEDCALGNGGLGRLAACFLDSAATHDLPLDGYGIRYKFGLFKQSFLNGFQVERADDWQKQGDPWSRRRDDKTIVVEFADRRVLAVPYDMPVIGFNTSTIGTLRLFQSEAEEEFDFAAFNSQEYALSVREKNAVEDITRVLYPNDSTYEGKRLRLKQQYFLSAASLGDILRRHKRVFGTVDNFAETNAIQLNDTHPTVSIPELVRLLMNEGKSFDDALDIARRTFSYTNHTLMSEALETWDCELFRSVIPNILDIIFRINDALHRELTSRGLPQEKINSMYIVADGRIHMARLATFVSSYVNGVAQIHSGLLRTEVLKDWYDVYPERFQNKTNGVTQRRFLGLCNPALSTLIGSRIGYGFMTDLYELKKLEPLIDDELIRGFIAVKREAKRKLSDIILQKEGVEIPPEFVFDIQVKRMHEYKRQLMNALSIVHIYRELKEGRLSDMPPAAFIFGAKAAPGYIMAKNIIKYINELARCINSDLAVRDKMRVVFVSNYNCSYAEHIIPAADISEQISAAGTEASGTGNMKFMINGAVTLGTYDGANIEIVECAGEENNYIFGARVEELTRLRPHYNPRTVYESSSVVRRAVDSLVDDSILNAVYTLPQDSGAKEEARRVFTEVYNSLLTGDWRKPDYYFNLYDLESYIEAKLRAIYDTADERAFARKCLMNTANSGKFSSDRTIREYSEELWHIRPIPTEE